VSEEQPRKNSSSMSIVKVGRVIAVSKERPRKVRVRRASMISLARL
jgi:hypothetical protein